VYGPVRTVVWQGSAGDCRPYADQTGLPEIELRSVLIFPLAGVSHFRGAPHYTPSPSSQNVSRSQVTGYSDLIVDTNPNPGFQPLLGGKNDRNEIRAYYPEFYRFRF
jgi:hypothetical protein